jgi:hypothetical protein
VSDPKRPTETPPDLPPEYAEAYRRGYERAYREAAGSDPGLPAQRGPGDTEETLVDVPAVPAHAAEPAAEEPPPVQEPRHVEEPAHVEEPEEQSAFDRLFAPVERADPVEQPEPAHRGETHEDKDRPGWLVPLLLGALVIVLLVGAYGIGRVFSTSVDDADVSTGKPDGVEVGDTPAGSEDSTGEDAQGSQGSPRPSRYQGRVNSAPIGSASASCQSPSSVDAAGNPVRYPPANLHDGDMSTAWRCGGGGVGETVTIKLPEQIRIGEVGLVPGYAKTDPRNGADRYAENNRITKVRWTFPGGASFVQTLDGSADNRSMQTRRIPATRAGEVVIEILDSVRGPRNTTAISEVRIGQVA